MDDAMNTATAATARARRSATREDGDDEVKAVKAASEQPMGGVERRDSAYATPVATRGGAGQTEWSTSPSSNSFVSPKTPPGSQYCEMLYRAWPAIARDVGERVRAFEAFAETIERVAEELKTLEAEEGVRITLVQVFAELAQHSGIFEVVSTPPDERTSSPI